MLIASFILSSVGQARRLLARDFDFGSFWFCCLLMTVLHNMTESSIDTFTHPLTALLLFLAFSAPAETAVREAERPNW